MEKLVFLFLQALLWLSCFLNVASGKPVIVSLPGRSVQLRGEVADFGYQFDQALTHPANLVLAPEEDPFLCSYPSSLENSPPLAAASPLALFVSRGECSFEEKAKVALALQENFTKDIQYVILYNNDSNNPSQLILMGAVDFDLPSLGFVAVSTRAGAYTLSSILYYAEATEQSPYLSANATDWTYPIDIQEFRSYSRGGGGSNTFYFLRFVLFSLLIMAPCLRAAYLWWNGGGRIEFRRNERGRITGLQYVRPTPYWFAPSAQGQGRPERAQLLTEEQVCALPEITYVKPADEEDTDDASTESSIAPVAPMESGKAEEEPTIIVDPITADNKKESTTVVRSTTEAAIIVDNNNDEEKGQAHQDQATNGESPETSPTAEEGSEDLTTSCTTCSICIDDFEEGERIRLLPKCKHAFHTDCLMPWLTERQGCCPLCKRSVLGPDDEDGSENEESSDAEEGLAGETGVAPGDRHEQTQSREEDEGRRSGETAADENNDEVQGQTAAEESASEGQAYSRTQVRSGDSPV